MLVVRELRVLIHRHEKAWMSAIPEPDRRAYIELLHRIQDSLGAKVEARG